MKVRYVCELNVILASDCFFNPVDADVSRAIHTIFNKHIHRRACLQRVVGVSEREDDRMRWQVQACSRCQALSQRQARWKLLIHKVPIDNSSFL